jgi:hypothetical protein
VPNIKGKIWTTEDLAAHFGVDVETVRRWHRKKLLRSMKHLRSLRFHDVEVERFIRNEFGIPANHSPRLGRDNTAEYDGSDDESGSDTRAPRR